MRIKNDQNGLIMEDMVLKTPEKVYPPNVSKEILSFESLSAEFGAPHVPCDVKAVTSEQAVR